MILSLQEFIAISKGRREETEQVIAIVRRRTR